MKTSHLLGGAVVEVRKIETGVLGADDHLVEGVADVGVGEFVEAHGVGVVGVDGDHGDALRTVVGGQLDQTLLVATRGRAVVRREDDAE